MDQVHTIILDYGHHRILKQKKNQSDVLLRPPRHLYPPFKFGCTLGHTMQR